MTDDEYRIEMERQAELALDAYAMAKGLREEAVTDDALLAADARALLDNVRFYCPESASGLERYITEMEKALADSMRHLRSVNDALRVMAR